MYDIQTFLRNVMVKYNKPSLFTEVTFLSNSMTTRTIMCKIKVLQEKCGKGNQIPPDNNI